MRKVLVAVGSVVVIGFAALAVWVLATALQSDHPAGFQTVMVADPGGSPIEVGIWYPTDARPWPKLTGLIMQWVATDAPIKGDHHPLIVISHGIAGALSSHADTALALADAGFVVAAPLHTGDNYRDQSAIGTTAWYPDRVRHVHLTISYMLEQWRERGRIDANKVGIFGFSAGGATALIAIGGVPDFDRIKEHCAKVQEFACDIWRKTKAPPPDWRDFLHDPRIKAAVVIAPGAGFAFAQYGLAGVDVPVQLWGGEKDESVPTATNAEIVHRALGQRTEWHLVPNAGHFSFMVPCGPARLIAPKMICEDSAGFDRAAFHKTFNRQVVAFFQKTLAAAPPLSCISTAVPICVPLSYLDSVEHGSEMGDFDAYGRLSSPQPIVLSGHRSLAIYVLHTDAFVEYLRSSLDVACTKTWCVYYRKECNPANTECYYEILKPVRAGKKGEHERVMTGMQVHARAINKLHFAHLQDEVFVAASNWTRPPEYLPLKAFSRTWPLKGRYPSNEGMIACDPCKQTPGCQRPLMEENDGLRQVCSFRP